MGSKSRRFNEVYARAQEILRRTLSMELVELQNRVEDKEPPKDATQQQQQQQQKEKGKKDKEKKDVTGLKKKGAF